MEGPDPIVVKAVEVLEKMRALLERGWVQGSMAMHGREHLDAGNERATRFCLLGAIERVTPYWEGSEWAKVRELALREFSKTVGIPDDSVSRISWNDAGKRRKQHVLDALDQTISRLKAK